MTYPGLSELGQQQDAEPQFGFAPLSAQFAAPPPSPDVTAALASQQLAAQQVQQQQQQQTLMQAALATPAQPASPASQPAPSPTPTPAHHGGGIFGDILSGVGKVAGAIGTGVNDIAKYTTDPLIGEAGNILTRPGEAGSFSAAQKRGEELSSGSGLPLPLKALVQTATNPLQAAVTGAEIAGAVLGAPETGGLSLGLLAGPAAQFGLAVGWNAASDAVMQHASSIPGFDSLSPQQQQGLALAISVAGSSVSQSALERVGGSSAISDYLKPTHVAEAAYDEPSIGDAFNELNKAQAEVQGDEPTPVEATVHDSTEPVAGTHTSTTQITANGKTTTIEGDLDKERVNAALEGKDEPARVEPPSQPAPKPGMVGPLPLRDLSPQPLSHVQSAMQTLRRALGQTPYDPQGITISRWIQSATQEVENNAAMEMGVSMMKVRSAFGNAFRTGAGNIDPSIALGEDGADLVPISWVAAHLPEYESRLTPQQITALRYVSGQMTKFNDEVETLTGKPVGQAEDIMDGGLYIGRGRADLEGADNPMPKSGTRWGKASQLKHRTFETPMEALAAGYHYAPLEDVIYSGIRNMGQLVIQSHVANYLKTAVDEDGDPLGQTPADRISQQLKYSYQSIAQQVASLRGRVNTAVTRAGANLGKADELDRALDDITIRVPDQAGQIAKLPAVLGKLQEQSEAMRGVVPEEQYESPYAGSGFRVKMPASPEAVIAAQHMNAVGDGIAHAVTRFQQFLPDDTPRIAGLEAAIRRTGSRLDVLRTRGEAYSATADDLQARLSAAQSQLDGIKEGYQRAVEQARQTPRGQATIPQISALNGWTFPDVLAGTIRKELDRGAPATGRGATLVNTLAGASDLMRGMKFAGAVAWAPIHGIIGMANTLGSVVNPLERTHLAFPMAVVTSLRSLADADAQGAALSHIDDGLHVAGLPGLEEGTLAGKLHIGRDYEFSMTGEGTRNPLSTVAEKMQKLPIIKQANRAWTTGTNVLRAEEYAYLVRQTARTTADINDPDVIAQIGNAANRASGYSVNRVGGDIGDMLLFAPRLLQSQLELVVKGMQGAVSAAVPGMSADIEQTAALKDLGHLYGVMTGLSVLANQATGTKVPWKNFADPFDPEFLRFEWNGEHWSLFGPWDTYLRAIVGLTTSGLGAANAIAHANAADFGANLSNMEYPLREASSPLVGTVWDMVTKTNIMGQKMTAGQLLQDLMPMGTQNIPGVPGREKIGAAGVIANQVGVKNSPLTPTQQLNAIAQGKYGKSWSSLMPSQQAAIKSLYPNVWQDKVNQMPAETQRYYSMKADLTKQQEADDQAYQSGKMSRATWANNYRSRQQKLYGLQLQAFGQSTVTSNPKTPAQVYNNIITEATAADGTVDWDAVDAAVASQSPDVQAWIADQRTIGITPVVKVYAKALNQYREAAQISTIPGFTGQESNQVISAYYSALSFAATHFFSTKSDLVQLALLTQLNQIAAGAGANGKKVATGALMYAMGALPYLPFQKRAFELSHPLIGMFGLGGGSQGALSPQEQAQLASEVKASS